MTEPTIKQVAIRLWPTAGQMLDQSRRYMFQAVADGTLDSFLMGRRRYTTPLALEEHIARRRTDHLRDRAR